MLEKINAFVEVRDSLKKCGVYGFSENYLQLNHKKAIELAQQNDIEVEFVQRNSRDYPFEATVQLNGIKLIGVMSRSEAEEFGLLDTCPICGHKKEANADTLAIAK